MSLYKSPWKVIIISDRGSYEIKDQILLPNFASWRKMKMKCQFFSPIILPFWLIYFALKPFSSKINKTKIISSNLCKGCFWSNQKSKNFKIIFYYISDSNHSRISYWEKSNRSLSVTFQTIFWAFYRWIENSIWDIESPKKRKENLTWLNSKSR